MKRSSLEQNKQEPFGYESSATKVKRNENSNEVLFKLRVYVYWKSFQLNFHIQTLFHFLHAPINDL